MSTRLIQNYNSTAIKIGSNKVDCYYRNGRISRTNNAKIGSANRRTNNSGRREGGLSHNKSINSIEDIINLLCDSESDLEELLSRIKKNWYARRTSDGNASLRRSFNTGNLEETDPAQHGDPPLPSVAPKFWRDRPAGRATNPAKFTRDVYGDWIGRGLTRALIGDLDPELYRAYATWIRRHPMDDLELPLVRQRYGEEHIASLLSDPLARKAAQAAAKRLSRSLTS